MTTAALAEEEKRKLEVYEKESHKLLVFLDKKNRKKLLVRSHLRKRGKRRNLRIKPRNR